MTDGPRVNLWDAIGLVLWVVAVGLIMADTFSFAADGGGPGPLAPYGILVALMAAVLSFAGIARRCLDQILDQMKNAYDLGRDSAMTEMEQLHSLEQHRHHH